MFEGCRALILALRGLLYVLQDVIGYSVFCFRASPVFRVPKAPKPMGVQYDFG